MIQCKHWHNGVCKDCTEKCPIKAKLMRKAAKAARKNVVKPERLQRSASSPVLAEALAHGERVARLAEKIYTALSPTCGIAAPWDRVLYAAARLHDVGWVYGQEGHHKVSARMIRAGGIEELAKDIRPLAALVARYHRRTKPSARQRRFAALTSAERQGVRRMAAVLRVADALDFSHVGLVHDLDVTVQNDAIHLILTCPEDCTAEVNRVDAKKQLFKKVFKKDVVCQCKAPQSPMPESLIPTSTVTKPLNSTAETTVNTAEEAASQAKISTKTTPLEK